MTFFDESRLDDEVILAVADVRLRALAESGARVRRAALAPSGRPPRLDSHPARSSRRAPIATPARGARTDLPGPVRRVAQRGAAGLGRRARPRSSSWRRPAMTHRPRVRSPRRYAGSSRPRRDPQRLAGGSTRRRPRHRPARGRHHDQLALAVLALNVLGAYGLGPVTELEEVAQAARRCRDRLLTGARVDHQPCEGTGHRPCGYQPAALGGSVPVARAARRIAEALRRAPGVRRWRVGGPIDPDAGTCPAARRLRGSVRQRGDRGASECADPR